jgi:predicted cupin superfamily sugar epimerase
MNAEAHQLISKLGLIPLPQEGGFFVRTWTSEAKTADGRPAGSAILFLITKGEFSALHRLAADEIWHFHGGDPAELALLGPVAGSGRTIVLGPDVAGAHVPAAVVLAGTWQGARILPGSAKGGLGWSLFGCTVSPGWDERDFELARREALLGEFPRHASIIAALTR